MSEAEAREEQEPQRRCPRCGSPRWVSVSLDEGYTRRAQCVPCGAIHPGVIGAGWRSVREALAPLVDGTGREGPADADDPAALLAREVRRQCAEQVRAVATSIEAGNLYDEPMSAIDGQRIWFDTEFIEDGRTIELLSIGAVREDGATYYAEPAETDRTRADDWVTANVLPHLDGPVKPRAVIAAELVEFAGRHPEWWAYYADYDWVALCQLYGRMIDLPASWPMYCRDLQQAADVAGVNLSGLPMTGREHNALDDALWARDAAEHLWTT